MPAPVGAYNFNVQLIDTALPGTAILSTLAPPPAGGFSECAGLESSMQVEEYREGGRNDGVLKFPGRIAGANIKLKRGVGISADLWTWHELYLRGQGKRRDGVIELLDNDGSVISTWRFRRGIPIRWVGPSLVAGQSHVAVEELEIAHEGLKVQTGGVLGELASTIGSIGQSLGGL
jgi:phage tail-like protein